MANDTSTGRMEQTINDGQPAGIVDTGDKKPSPETASETSESLNKPTPHLHAKTYLAVAAVCLIYIAQLVCLVGAGAVSTSYRPSRKFTYQTVVSLYIRSELVVS